MWENQYLTYAIPDFFFTQTPRTCVSFFLGGGSTLYRPIAMCEIQGRPSAPPPPYGPTKKIVIDFKKNNAKLAHLLSLWRPTYLPTLVAAPELRVGR